MPQILSDDELKALLAADLDTVRANNRRWFWIRSTVVLIYIAAMTITLLFFPGIVLARFDFPQEIPHGITEDYLLLRAVTVIAATVLYLFSYLRQWYFSYVALAAILIAVGNFVNDFFSLYIFIRPDAIPTLIAILCLRVLIILLLVLNFLSTRHEIRRL